MGIIFCQMAMNRLSEVKECIKRYLPFVDHYILVDGGSIDDSIFYFRNLEKEEPKFHFYIKNWTDKFFEQRNFYLRQADTFAKEGDFVLVSDPDEWFEAKTMNNLEKITEYMSKVDANVATFQSRSVSLRGETRVWENTDDYWKHLLYRWEPNMRYVGNPHETMIIPSGFRALGTPFIYEHVKQEDVTWHRGARNFFVWGVGRDRLLDEEQKFKFTVWSELFKALAEVKAPTTWHSFDRYLIAGNIATKVKSWMIKYRNVTGFEFDSEARELYKLYFRIYHSEEEPQELRNESL